MGHPQPATPMQVDNSTANGIINNTVKQQTFPHHGHVVLLDKGPNPTRSIPRFLGTWTQQSSRLLHKAPFANSSLQHAPSLST
jgi:hypothetical protein